LPPDGGWYSKIVRAIAIAGQAMLSVCIRLCP
jgi:hypothetical protein